LLKLLNENLIRISGLRIWIPVIPLLTLHWDPFYKAADGCNQAEKFICIDNSFLSEPFLVDYQLSGSLLAQT